MKTTIKIIFLSAVCLSFFLWNTDTYANWYDPQWQNISIVNCPEDAQVDLVGPTLADLTWPLGGLWIYFETATYGRNRQAQVTTYSNPLMQCYYWDSTAPTASNLEYAPPVASWGWQNTTTITLNWSASDTGGSGLKNYDIRVYSSWSQGIPTVLSGTITTPTNATTYTYTGLDGYSYSFEICPRDVAFNVCTSWTSNISSNGIVRIDTTNPAALAADLRDTSSTDSSSWHVLVGNQTFNFTFNDLAAPVKVWYRVENNIDYTLFDSAETPGYSYNYNYIVNITKVDNDRWANGWREFSIIIDQVCDQAWNCIGSIWWGIKTFTHYVYSDPNYLPTNIPNTSAITSAIADGQSNNFIQTINDGYGNDIIPATGIGRVITIGLSGISNTMFLNQYTRLGLTSVYVTAPTTTVIADEPLNFGGSQSFLYPATSSDGAYPLALKVYTPTANSYASITDPVSDPLAAFSFTMNLSVTDTLGTNKTFSQLVDTPNFSPLYVTNISWDLRNGGFIEGTEQQSHIAVTNNSPSVTPTSIELQLEFSGSSSWDFDLYGWSITNSSTSILTRSAMVTNPGKTSTSLFTKLVQKPNITVSSGSTLQLSTHFAYTTLDWKNVLYNSDIIGKQNYFSSMISRLGNQVGIKIIGPIASNAIASIVSGQFADGTSIFSWLTRSIVRNNMIQSVSLATRNIQLSSAPGTLTTLSSLPSGWPSLWGIVEKWGESSIIQLERTGWNIILNLSAGISGKRTLVIKWANLYITGNMWYANPDSILWVVVQKDKDGYGGNLYVDPSITNIVGTYILDGSIMSYDGVSEIGVSNIGILKNQLHIYGSILSENTFGGSRMNPIKCPTLLNISCTTISDAQKYDLNYLRRYYLYSSIPFGWAKVIWGATCTPLLCNWFDSNLIRKFTTPSEDLAKYPVIIEYNPLMRISPPIGFEESKD